MLRWFRKERGVVVAGAGRREMKDSFSRHARRRVRKGRGGFDAVCDYLSKDRHVDHDISRCRSRCREAQEACSHERERSESYRASNLKFRINNLSLQHILAFSSARRKISAATEVTFGQRS